MAKWDIHVDGVRAVLNDTVDAAKPLEHDAKSLGHEMNNAAEASADPYLDVVCTALQGFADHAETVLPAISSELKSVLNGAAKATIAFVQGDEQMGREAEARAARAVKDQDPFSTKPSSQPHHWGER